MAVTQVVHAHPGAMSCAAQLSSFRTARDPLVAAAFRNISRRADTVAALGLRRRVWDLIPLGLELDMLWLHTMTLESVVDGFLVMEATTTHTGDVRKPAFARDALANGTVPTAAIARKLRVRVIDFAEERRRFCPNPHIRCYEALQRFLLLDMLFEVAGPDDIALVNDVDEFVRPSVVTMLRQCYPFDAYSHSPPYLSLRLSLFKFGVHCDHGAIFDLGARVFSVGTLMARYSGHARATRTEREAMSVAFTNTRSRPTVVPGIEHAGWHLTSFGAADYLAIKLRTFLHSNIFNSRERVAKGSLDVPRLERCIRWCLDLDKPSVGGVMPPCNGREDRASRHLPGIRRTNLASADLPGPLLHHRSRWPTSWFRFLDAP